MSDEVLVTMAFIVIGVVCALSITVYKVKDVHFKFEAYNQCLQKTSDNKQCIKIIEPGENK